MIFEGRCKMNAIWAYNPLETPVWRDSAGSSAAVKWQPKVSATQKEVLFPEDWDGELKS
jgi:hypothetical protein